MPPKIKQLDARLQMVAALVPTGARLADIGTDHAYLPVHLLRQGGIEHAIASDIGQGPLRNAAQTVQKAGFSARVELRLSDGLAAYDVADADCFVFAGMGGTLIAQLLDAADWLPDVPRLCVIAQPMSHPEDVRRWFCKNHFWIEEERVCQNQGRCYCAMRARLALPGEMPPTSESFPYAGLLPSIEHPAAHVLLRQTYGALAVRAFSLEKAGRNPDESAYLRRVMREMQYHIRKEMITMPTVGDIEQYINFIAPAETQMEGDNNGCLAGDRQAEVRKCLVCLDITADIIQQAAARNAELIVSHHPVIFIKRKQIFANDPVYMLAQAGIAAIAAHTPFDCTDGGVTDILAEQLGLQNIREISSVQCKKPCLRAGEIAPRSASDFAGEIAERLRAHVQFCDTGKPIARVAVCGGGGGEFLYDAIRAGANAYVTGDLQHHHFLEALQNGMCVFAAGHFETE
ncbi:MAG: Nif3-like dinuclear metal center hexameric protein, partial [Oscillospiraceae bacterium]|nr:Nif3-like dinuclear metal center hexameric protein [Oscillospiraceae bacterium]